MFSEGEFKEIIGNMVVDRLGEIGIDAETLVDVLKSNVLDAEGISYILPALAKIREGKSRQRQEKLVQQQLFATAEEGGEKDA